MRQPTKYVIQVCVDKSGPIYVAKHRVLTGIPQTYHLNSAKKYDERAKADQILSTIKREYPNAEAVEVAA